MIHRLSNPENRIKTLEGRLQQYPASAAFFPLASLLREKGEIEYAESLLKNGLATYPNYAAAGILLGEILISKGEHEQAVRFLVKSLEIAPWNFSGQRLLAECYQKNGDEEAAQVALRVADMFEADEIDAQRLMTDSIVDDNPVVVPEGELDAVATPALAELYVEQGHLEKARDIYERLLESDTAKIEWSGRLAAIREQLSLDEEVDSPSEYSEMEENLDLIGGEPKGVREASSETKADVVSPANLQFDVGDAETSSAELENLAEGSSPTEEVSELDKEGRESIVNPGEQAVVDEKIVDSVLREMIELYVQEENDAQALDMCRKAQVLGRNAPWILEKISALERKVGESAASLLRKDAEEVTDSLMPVLSLADEKVVRTLESWLETLQRRKANA